jgi:chorismate synthase
MLGNTFGRVFRVTASGESYGTALLTIIDGVPSGLPLSEEDIQPDLDRRRPHQSPITSPREETDRVKVVSGVLNGYTTGAPVGLLIYNVDTQPHHIEQYRKVNQLMRPGHADYTFHVKYGKYRDWIGAGRASGRETAGRVAAGAVAKKMLSRQGIRVVAYTKEMAGIRCPDMDFEDIIANVESNMARCPDPEAAEKMIERTMEVKRQGDTVGGIVEVIARGVPAGVGEPVFDKVTAEIAKGLMSIGSVKGVEIGEGFAVAAKLGSETNDIPYIDNGKVRFKTNYAGGLLGGITTGEDIVARCAVKPTSTMRKDQPTINMFKMEETVLAAETRYDVTIVPRVVPVAEAMLAMIVVDEMMMYRGWQSFLEEA